MEWLVERLVGLIPLIKENAEKRRELADNALSVISRALNETSLYVQHIQNGGAPDRSREEELARYWSAAAIPVRHLDREFAEMCHYKSELWTSPDNWNPEKLTQYGIDLDSVKQKYTDLLRTA